MRGFKFSIRRVVMFSATMVLAPVCALRAVSPNDPPVGTIENFGPNLQQVAGGVCRQPEGIALDFDGNFYLASNSDSATTVGHVSSVNS